MTAYSFPRQEKLKDAREIRDVFASRERYSTDGMRLIVRKNGLERNRVLFAPSRGYRNAVKRNRAKRIGREIYRHIRNTLYPGHDLAFVLFLSDDSYVSRETQIIRLCQKAGILRPTGE